VAARERVVTMRERMSEWWRPTLAVPTLGGQGTGLREGKPGGGASGRGVGSVSRGVRSVRPSPPSGGLSALFGHAHGVNVYVVSPRGVEIPVNNALGWTVVDLCSLLFEIDDLPEIEPGSLRA
jgi:hypothetical protein